jgi:DNA polymerase III delta subunit
MPKPVYALVGADSFLQLQELAHVLSEVGNTVQRVDVDGEKAELAEVLDELRSFAMFGPGKLVVVRNADEFLSRFKEPLEDYVAKPSDSATLVLRFNTLRADMRVTKAIAKNGEVRKCDPPRDIAGWIVQRAKSEHKLAISPDAARLMKELLGDDLGRIDNELAKLAIQNDSGKIQAGEISDNVTFQREQEMTELTNALAEGRPVDAIKLWRHMTQLDPSSEFRAVTWLIMWLEDVRTYLTSPGSFKNVWRYKSNLPQFQKNAKSMGKEKLAILLDALADTDRRSKSGLGEASENVERFILSIAAQT